MGNPVLTNLASRNVAPVVGSYICDGGSPGCPCENAEAPPGGHIALEERHCWHESARRRLTHQYGEARANRISLGIDAKTNADVAAWNRLGQRQEIAA